MAFKVNNRRMEARAEEKLGRVEEILDGIVGAAAEARRLVRQALKEGALGFALSDEIDPVLDNMEWMASALAECQSLLDEYDFGRDEEE